MDSARGSVVGYEALARFADEEVVDPATWFAAAHRLDRVAELEAAALRAALARRDTLPPNTFLTVNLGPDVLGSAEVLAVLTEQSSLSGLVVELTEHARVESYVELEPVLDRIRGEGALIALDDAGTGYAGLSHMLNIRPSLVKLDRGLIAGLDRDEAKQSLVEMMGTLSGRLDAWLLVEGVETRAELDALVRLGVPLLQGFYLACPAAEWGTVSVDTALHLMGSATTSSALTLRRLLDTVPTAPSVELARDCFDLDHVDLVVVLDESSRPWGTLTPSGLVLSAAEALRFNVDTPVVDAAQRAVARSAAARGGPLLCTDNAGRFVGVVRMESVVKALAAAVGGPDLPVQGAARRV